MAPPVRVRRLTEQEGQKLQQIVRRGSTNSVRFRRAMMLLASAGGSAVPVIARLVQADEDSVREVIHRLNEIGLACLNPQWAGGRPRLLSSDDEDFVIQTATTRPTVLGMPFTRWSVRKLVDHLRRNISRPIQIGREALRFLWQFTLANSNHPNHTVQTRALHAYLRWRNANARHPDVLAAQRRERARIRGEKGIRWGGRLLKAAA